MLYVVILLSLNVIYWVGQKDCPFCPTQYLQFIHAITAHIYVCISVVAQTVKHSPAMQETWLWSLGREDPLEKEIATHSRIPWTGEPVRLQSMGSQRVGHDWMTNTHTHICIKCGVAVVQLLSCVGLFVIPWTAACQVSLSFTICEVCSNSCPLTRSCHPTISSSIVPLMPLMQENVWKVLNTVSGCGVIFLPV